MVTEHADTDLKRNKEVVLRFMRLMDGAPRDLDVLDEVLAQTFGFSWGPPTWTEPRQRTSFERLYSVSGLQAYPEEVPRRR